MSRWFLACSSPAIAKLWPSRNSIVVRASRLVIDGITEAGDLDGFCEVELAYRRRQAQIDDAASQDRRHERQLYAEGLELGGDDWHAASAPRLRRRHRKFAARQEGGGVTGECNQVRLGQASDEALRFQCGQSNVEVALPRLASATPKGAAAHQRSQGAKSPEY